MSRGRLAFAFAVVLITFAVSFAAGFLYRDNTAQAEIDSIGRDVTIRDATKHLSLLTNLERKNYDAAETSVTTYLYGDMVAMQVMFEQGASDRFKEQACTLVSQVGKLGRWVAENSEDAKRMRKQLAELQATCGQQKR